MNTEQLAAALHIKPASIRVRFCNTGSYYCLRPIKLPNRRLMWPADSVALLSKQAASQHAPSNTGDIKRALSKTGDIKRLLNGETA